jgi:hypothetical protein
MFSGISACHMGIANFPPGKQAAYGARRPDSRRFQSFVPWACTPHSRLGLEYWNDDDLVLVAVRPFSVLLWTMLAGAGDGFHLFFGQFVLILERSGVLDEFGRER